MAYVAGSFSTGQVPTTALWNQLWTNDAAFNNATGINAGVINANNLSASIFSGQVVTYTPTIMLSSGVNTSNPQIWYINLGGWKLLWGTVFISYVGTSTGHVQLSLPPGLFTAIHLYWPAIYNEGNYAFQWASGDSYDATQFKFYTANGGDPGSATVSFTMIGV